MLQIYEVTDGILAQTQKNVYLLNSYVLIAQTVSNLASYNSAGDHQRAALRLAFFFPSKMGFPNQNTFLKHLRASLFHAIIGE